MEDHMDPSDTYLNMVRDRLVEDGRGAQSGVLALAALVTPKADDAAKKLATSPFRLGVGGFAAMVQPAVVDLSEGRVHTFQGRRLWGAAFGGYLRNKRAFYLPDPG
jgi:hypothetical protein